MGDPVGPEYTAGIQCPDCWGFGKAFGDVPTPKYASITFSGLLPPWDVANKKFIGEQDPLIPCKWDFEDATVIGNYVMNIAFSRVQLEMKDHSEDPEEWFGGACDDNIGA